VTLAPAIAAIRASGPDLRRDARILLGHVLGKRSPAPLEDSGSLPPGGERRFLELWRRRLAGEPVQYLIGEWDFYGRAFRTDRRALIPRPETEHLVEEALREAPDARRGLDLGCGSGVVAITLARELPGARLVAVDASIGALALARQNAARHGVADRVDFVGSDWTAALAGARFDLAVSNPPYVAAADAGGLPPEVADWEPAAALFAGSDGLSEIRALLSGLPPRLSEEAPFLFEIGFGQRDAVEAEVALRPEWDLRRFVPDLSGIPRVCVLRRSRRAIPGSR
jgi:release factor glutamine methyltransferase